MIAEALGLVAAWCLVAIVCLSGCPNTTIAHLHSLGHNAHVQCWSGGLKFFDGMSDGKVMNADSSDGYEFMNAATEKLTQVSGNCMVEYDK